MRNRLLKDVIDNQHLLQVYELILFNLTT